jgi:hypothetical protein
MGYQWLPPTIYLLYNFYFGSARLLLDFDDTAETVRGDILPAVPCKIRFMAVRKNMGK